LAKGRELHLRPDFAEALCRLTPGEATESVGATDELQEKPTPKCTKIL